ncbi:MAG TPA: TetR/AcrR family transcriptional regulator [Hyphomicrobiaceae bacterium]
MPIDSHAALPLRDRKKARQRAELLRVAAELFRREGYEGTRMEDIAAQADVSVPTVYNYFAGKRDVLIDLLMQDRRETQTTFEVVVNNPPDEPADAFAALIHANMANIRSPEDKRLWRDLIAAVAKAHDREQDQFEKNHEIFRGYIKRLLRHFMRCGKLSGKLPLSLAADIIFAINSSNLRYLVAAESCTPEEIQNLARRQMALLMTDWSIGDSRKVAPLSPQMKGSRKPSPRRRATRVVGTTDSSGYQEAD